MSKTAIPSREWTAVAVLALGFGLVGIDRFLISTLFPLIARDLKLGYSAIGSITGALAIAWGLSALVMGNLADRIGHRKVLVGALILFSLLIGASGLAAGLISLILVRLVMGAADGAFTPASISATIAVSPQRRHGRNIGVQQMTLTLFGLGLAPLLVAALLHVLDWRWIFSIFIVPGMITAYATHRLVPAVIPLRPTETTSFDDWRAVLIIPNIRILMPAMLCWLTCLITTSAFMPNYLLDQLGLNFGQMGGIMSAIGFGSATGTLLLPWLSDAIGRKTVMLIAAAGTAVALLWLASLGPTPAYLFGALFLVHFFNNALITLTVGPLCSESVPPSLMATASGLIIAVGELLGGGLAPILAGVVADRFGIGKLLWLPIATTIAGCLLCVALRETRVRPSPHLRQTETIAS